MKRLDVQLIIDVELHVPDDFDPLSNVVSSLTDMAGDAVRYASKDEDFAAEFPGVVVAKAAGL